MPLISIVVPVYKVEPYLNRCVDSILGQSFQNFELILIDDGSPDRCGEVCDGYAVKDDRIHVIHQENGGLSAARNAGIDWAFANSDSEWITFVDSDDWIHERYLELMYRTAEKNNADVVIAGYEMTKGDKPVINQEKTGAIEYSVEDYYVNHIVNATVAWGKLYRKNCFQSLRYPVGKIHEDEYVTYKILFQQKSVYVIEQPLYAYFQNVDGIIRGKWTPRRLDSIDACEQQVAFFSEKGFLNAAKERFKSLILQLSEGRLYIDACEELSKEEKKNYKRRVNGKKTELMKKYKDFHWITLKNRGLFLLAYDTQFPPFLVIYRFLVFIKRLFGKDERKK